MDNYVGKRLDGRYEIQEIIGVGGMSVVYKAYDSVDDRIVAVKILKEEYASDADFIRRFKNESKAIAVLSHPNIVKVYDVNFGDKLQYIVMEYVDGITLKEYIEKQKIITWNEALYFTTQILRALQHAHDNGIVHRDIKPQNIILLQNGNIKVTDFGIARFAHTDTRTVTENAMGSVHYISPEQAKGEFTDERADIYSLGSVLYEMLTGTVPFEAESAVSVALMQVNKEPVRPREINPDIPIGLEQICLHAMQKDPNDRYQTATEMLLDIEEIISNPSATFDYINFHDDEPTKFIDPVTSKKDDVPETTQEVINNDTEEDQPKKSHRKAKIVIGTILGVILLIAVVIGLILWLTKGFDIQTYTVDNFVGRYYDDIVSNGDYEYEIVATYEESSEYDTGIVISQNPESGDKVAAGTTVTLVVAQSNDSISVPNCYNLTLEKAAELLKSYNINNYRAEYSSSETVKDGYVIYTNPKAGSNVSAEDQIIIYVSTGPSTTQLETYEVPSVEGLSQNDAKKVLEEVGFTNIEISNENSTVTKGTVLSQSPVAGTSISQDASIVIVVSTGYTTTTTTQPVQYTIHLYIYLPECKYENGNYVSDTLTVYLNSSVYTSKTVTLNGDYVELAIPADNGTTINSQVVLNDLGASNSFKVKVTSDKDKTIDFSSYSDNYAE